jgi:hypothetical protein
VIAAGDEHTVGLWVVGEVVPSTFAAEFHAVREFERLLRCSRNHCDGDDRNDEGKNSLHDFSFFT